MPEASALQIHSIEGKARRARKTPSRDRFSEGAHRALMRSQAVLGERRRAFKHYEQLAKMLEERLGASPAPETTARYERLHAGEHSPGSV